MRVIPFNYNRPEYSQAQTEKYRNFQQRVGHWFEKWQVMSRLIGDASDKIVLDIGCSIGTYTLAMKGKCGLAIGLDFSETALNQAQLLDREYSGGSSVFLCNDISAMCLKNGCVDVVIGVDIIEHLSPELLARTYREIHRVLKSGGQVVLQTYPSRYYYFFLKPNKYELLAYPALLLPRRIVMPYFALMHRMISKMRMLYSHLRGYVIEQAHCNCQTLEQLVGDLQRVGFVVDEAFVENTYSEFERTPNLSKWERLLNNHEVTRNNIYVKAVKP